MNIIIGHTNMDLDCLGSMILAKKIFPDHYLVKSRLVHPVARNLYNLYQNHFEFINPKDLQGEKIEKIKIVDTSSFDRVKEYFAYITDSKPEIEIFDHHPAGGCNIQGAMHHSLLYGANTTALGILIKSLGISLLPEEATIALTGIYADTGRFIYENVTREDFEIASFLMDQGASLKLVKTFLSTLQEDYQKELLHTLLNQVELRDVQGHSILLSYMELEKNISGLAAVVEQVMEIENPDAYFAVFNIRGSETTLLIARSQKDRIDLHHLLQHYGGGGHLKAGSAKIATSDGPGFFRDFLAYLEEALTPALRARDIMTSQVLTIDQNSTLLEASLFLEQTDHSGLPVVDVQGRAVGFLTLRDIMKGRRAGQMHAPVKAYMSRKLVSTGPLATIREIERIFYAQHIGHLPILEDDRILGIVTRWDYLQFKKNKFVAPAAVSGF